MVLSNKNTKFKVQSFDVSGSADWVKYHELAWWIYKALSLQLHSIVKRYRDRYSPSLYVHPCLCTPFLHLFSFLMVFLIFSHEINSTRPTLLRSTCHEINYSHSVFMLKKLFEHLTKCSWNIFQYKPTYQHTSNLNCCQNVSLATNRYLSNDGSIIKMCLRIQCLNPYVVCILFGMPSLHLFTFLRFFIYLYYLYYVGLLFCILGYNYAGPLSCILGWCMKAKVNVLAKPHPYIFFTLQLDSIFESLICSHPCSY